MAPADREPLSRDRIVQAAIEVVDKHGLTALTMRRLGQLLGVEAMSLYHHVNGREDLLEGMVSRLVDTLRATAEEPSGPVDGWQAFLQRRAHDIRTMALAHPNLFPLVATRPPAAPWLRPPLRSLRVVEEFLGGLLERGMPEDQTVHVYKVFSTFLLGHLLLESSELASSAGLLEEPLNEGEAEMSTPQAELDLDDYPTIQRLSTRLTRHDAEEQFEAALEALLVRLDRELSQ